MKEVLHEEPSDLPSVLNKGSISLLLVVYIFEDMVAKVTTII